MGHPQFCALDGPCYMVYEGNSGLLTIRNEVVFDGSGIQGLALLTRWHRGTVRYDSCYGAETGLGP